MLVTFTCFSQSRTHSEGICKAPVKLPFQSRSRVEFLLETISKAPQCGQTAAFLQRKKKKKGDSFMNETSQPLMGQREREMKLFLRSFTYFSKKKKRKLFLKRVCVFVCLFVFFYSLVSFTIFKSEIHCFQSQTVLCWNKTHHFHFSERCLPAEMLRKALLIWLVSLATETVWVFVLHMWTKKNFIINLSLFSALVLSR